MQCARCKADIADKAIVCYRCGAPTALPAVPERRPPAGRRHPLGLAIVILVLAAGAARGAWGLEPGSLGQAAAAALAVTGLIVAAVVFMRRRRG
jgi:hypothetical protein